MFVDNCPSLSMFVYTRPCLSLFVHIFVHFVHFLPFQTAKSRDLTCVDMRISTCRRSQIDRNARSTLCLRAPHIRLSKLKCTHVTERVTQTKARKRPKHFLVSGGVTDCDVVQSNFLAKSCFAPHRKRTVVAIQVGWHARLDPIDVQNRIARHFHPIKNELDLLNY